MDPIFAFPVSALLATVPVVGTAWLGGSYFILGGLVLLYVRAPWSLLILAGMAAVVTPITLALGHGEWAVYFSMGVPSNAVPLAIGIWLIRTARRLQEARLVLAEAAVVRERLRIERELRETVGGALEAIAGRGHEARALATREPMAAARELTALVRAARATLAAARRLITRYRDVSLRPGRRDVECLHYDGRHGTVGWTEGGFVPRLAGGDDRHGFASVMQCASGGPSRRGGVRLGGAITDAITKAQGWIDRADHR